MTPGERKSYDQSLKEFRDMYLMENELRKREAELKEQKAIIRKQNAGLRKRDADLKKKSADLEKKDADLEKKSADLEKKDAELEKMRSRNKNAVRILLEAGIPIEKIAESTGLSLKEIEQIKKTIR